MDKFLSSHFDLGSLAYYPEDFQGAAPGDELSYIPSDDEMECASSASVDDLDSLSDDDEVALLAECVERQMELPTGSESIPVPTSSSKQEEDRAGTPRLSYIPGPVFNAGYFVLGMGRGPEGPEIEKRRPLNQYLQPVDPNGEYTNVASALDKYPTGDWRAVAEATTNNNQQCPSGIHFR